MDDGRTTGLGRPDNRLREAGHPAI
ncbi:uncharacterized protein G2W53_017603 [Senna tora]|uniref:Uncharacterized protein n=1 Tax=Senna tora TaxID=362788 RepID=A0A834TYT3_9FABA|nr:uncharacterized protein G2W53_017603 [Senna tora]